ncbi:MAG: methylated-DNA--[protein]-cysteine S-methyltransferase [Spirochaetaceae bacterium]|jgi:O-6-methylguanine DNA methyltransferase|nr:methylated-DNA--[protein]-cysteine S-methyltransferase [Spirochaetaceae bacterium]
MNRKTGVRQAVQPDCRVEGAVFTIGGLQIAICAVDECVCSVSFGGLPDAAGATRGGIVEAARAQLEQYFSGRRTTFEIPLKYAGTAFQTAVWQKLLEIPYGSTRSYKQIAESVGRGAASRAVGGAVHVNPIAIIIPCHRVVGADGSLTGFAAGLTIKQKLLDLEQGGKFA